MNLNDYISQIETVGKTEFSQEETVSLVLEFAKLSMDAAKEMESAISNEQANLFGVYAGMTRYLMMQQGIPEEAVLFGLIALVWKESCK